MASSGVGSMPSPASRLVSGTTSVARKPSSTWLNFRPIQPPSGSCSRRPATSSSKAPKCRRGTWPSAFPAGSSRPAGSGRRTTVPSAVPSAVPGGLCLEDRAARRRSMRACWSSRRSRSLSATLACSSWLRASSATLSCSASRPLHSALVGHRVQVGERGEAPGQRPRVDRHGVPLFRSPNWRTRSTGQARGRPWSADQAQQPHALVVWAPADPVDGNNQNQPHERKPLS